MSFEFFSPEGIAVRCETVEELVASYTALWRDHQHTSGFFPDTEDTAPHETSEIEESKVVARHLVSLPAITHLPPLEEPEVVEKEVVRMPPHWAKIWKALCSYGQTGASVAEVADEIGRNRHTVTSNFSLMYHQGFIEKAERRGKWRVPKEIRRHRVVVGRLELLD